MRNESFFRYTGLTQEMKNVSSIVRKQKEIIAFKAGANLCRRKLQVTLKSTKHQF